MVYPLHRVELCEAGVLLRVLDVGQCIECEKLGGATQLGAFRVQVLFEVVLLLFKFFVVLGPRLVIEWVVDVDDEVNTQVEF